MEGKEMNSDHNLLWHWSSVFKVGFFLDFYSREAVLLIQVVLLIWNSFDIKTEKLGSLTPKSVRKFQFHELWLVNSQTGDSWNKIMKSCTRRFKQFNLKQNKICINDFAACRIKWGFCNVVFKGFNRSTAHMWTVNMEIITPCLIQATLQQIRLLPLSSLVLVFKHERCQTQNPPFFPSTCILFF